MLPHASGQFGYRRAVAVEPDSWIGRAGIIGLGVVVERGVAVVIRNVLNAVVHAVQTETEEVAPGIMRGTGLHPERDRETAIRTAAEGRGAVAEPDARIGGG